MVTDQLRTAIQCGDFEIKGQFTFGSNYTFLVTVHYDPEYHYFNFTDEDRRLLKPVVLFDLLCNNADRKGSHVFFENDTHKLYAIDHGICFHEDDKLRTVLWDFSGQKIPQDLLACLSLRRGLLTDLE